MGGEPAEADGGTRGGERPQPTARLERTDLGPGEPNFWIKIDIVDFLDIVKKSFKFCFKN